MKNIVRRSICLLLAFVLMMSCCAITAAAASPVTGVASDQWKQALDSTKSKTSYYSPHMAASNTADEYYDKIGTGHLQGMCVDDDLRYMYVSYTNGIGKIDMATGEVAGYLTGFDGGLHIGCLAYYDGHIYGSFEAQATLKFYIIQVDESQFWGVMDTREKWLDAVRVILLYEPTVDARDLMGDTWDNGDGIAGRNEEVGHRYSNAGIDGVTFGTYPGEFGKKDADVYMFVSYGTYWFTNGDTKLSNRLDDEHIILQAYNTKDFLNEQNQSQYLLELAYTDTTTPDQNGVSNARSLNYAADSILHAEKALFAFVGNTRWGCQQIEYDRTTGDIWLSTYGGSDGKPDSGAGNWYVIDGSKKPQHAEIQLGQNANAAGLKYGDIGKKTDEQKAAIVAAAKERATRYGDNNKVKNSTWDTWENKPQEFSENGYPIGDIPYMKCVCGNNCHGLKGAGEYIGYTAANGYDEDNMIWCGKRQYMCMGLVSLGNGYWYWNGQVDTQECLKLFHMDGFDPATGAVGTAVNITDANLADYVAMETAAGTLTSTVEDAKRTLQTRVTKTEQNYPNNAAGYSDASWTALQNALSGAKAVLADSSATAEQADAAMETLKTALKGMRKTAAFEPVLAAAKDEITRMSRTLYGAYIAKVEDAIANSASYSQTKLDDCVTSLEPLRAAQNPTVAAEFDSYTENVPTNTSIDLKNKGWELLKITVPTGQTAKVTADGKVIRTLTAGTYNVPIANVASMRIDGTADASVCRYEDLRTIAGITVDGESIYGFDQSILAYTVKIPTTATKLPKVGVKKLAGLDVTVDIQQATMENKTATITVTRKDNGVVTVYTVKFIADSSQNPTTEPAPDRVIYASDLKPLWETTYPNYRGLDGKNERFMADKGWVNPGDINNPNLTKTEKLAGVGLDGKQRTYAKGFTLHAITNYGMPTESEEHTFSNNNTSRTQMNGTALESGWKSTYTTRFQSTGYYFTNLSAEAAAKAAEEYYSSVSFDVSKYSSFSAIVGNLKETHGNANSTLRVYLDGTLAPEYTHKIVGGTGFELNVNLTNVSRMTIQLDPKNDGTPGNAGDWANGDIVCFGDAKFYQPDTEALIGELTPLWATSYPNYRGHDGKNERFMVNKGWDFPENIGKEKKLQGVAADGSKVEFTNGFTMHGITSYGMKNGEPELKADSSRKSDAEIKAEYVNADNFEHYSSISFNVKDFSRFSTTLSIAGGQKDHKKANATVRFYADGEVVKEVPINGKTWGVDVNLDLTGVRRLTIQLDPENLDKTITESNPADWANGDIVTFGNAKFTKSATIEIDPQDQNTYLSDLADSEHTTAKKVSDQGDGQDELTIAVTDPASGVHFMYKNSGDNNKIWGYSHVDDNGPTNDQISFNKWLTMEPLVAAQVGKIYGKALAEAKGALEMEYRQTFVNGDDGKEFADYSSVTWNIDGKGYDVFRCILGPRGGNTWSATDVNVNIYVDGVLRFTKNIRRWTGATDVEVDLTGAKTFTIQLDPLGDGTKLDDLASGDILIFGDARFVKLANRLTHTHTPASEWTQGEYGHWNACSGCAEHLNYAKHVLSGEPTEQTPQTCLICGKEIKEKLKHEPKRTASVAPTCTTPGNIEYFYCPNCGKYYSDEDCTQELVNGSADAFRAANGHSMTHVGAVEPTYDHVGNIEYWYCSACRKYFADGQGAQELTGSVILPKKEAPSSIVPILPLLDEQFPFVDVPVNSWYYASVRGAWENGLIDGVTAYAFKPDNQLTVAQAIKLAAALHQMQTSGSVTLTDGHPWYNTYLAYAIRNKVLGEEYKSYTAAQMNAPVTRGEFVHILRGATNYYTVRNEVADNAIPDVKVTDTYGADIYTFYRAGILTGSDAKGTFHADSTIRRSEVSAILNRMYDVSARQSIALK